MFFWLVAIPFFVIIAMFTLFRLPSDKLHSPEDIQDTGMAFRMVMQHDTAVKLMQRYRRDNESDMFNEGSYDLSGNSWKEAIMTSGYLPSSFIPDTDNITTYIRCLNGAKLVASCRSALGVYVITAVTPPSGNSITTRWFEQKGAENLAMQLKKYEGSFPIKQTSLVLPEKPKKGADETDEDFAIRLAAYNKERDEYHTFKRSRYDLGDKLPRPDTVVGQVQAYPFDNEAADARVIVRKIKAIGGEIVFENEDMPTNLPSGGEDSEPMDFNGEAVILSKSDLCKNGPCNCETGTDCGEGAYCLSAVCSGNCAGYGADEDRNCRNSCSSDSHCASGFYCETGSCRVKCTKDADCFSSKPYCNSGICGTTKVCTSNSDCPSSMPFCINKQCSTTYSISFTTRSTLLAGSRILNYSVTLPVTGKYKFDLKGESGSYQEDGYGSSSSLTHPNGLGKGGTLVSSKWFSSRANLQIRCIGGASNGVRSGGAGAGLFEENSLKMVAGGGSHMIYGGGGYNGGWSTMSNYSYRGYSWNGNTGSNKTTSGSGTGSYGGDYNAYGGSGYCGSGYSCSGTYGTNVGASSVTITYCGPNSNSSCP